MPSRYQSPSLAAGLVAIAVFCTTAACSRPPSQPATEPSPTPAPTPAPTPQVVPVVTQAEIAARLQQGIDVSVHSGTVDWAQVAAEGHTFAFVKATEGIDLKDAAFEGHWSDMKAAGIIRGAYHFYVTEDDPKTQAEFFISTVALESGDLAPVVDIEKVGHDTPSDWASKFGIWIETVEQHYGVKPIIYTSPNFWNEHLTDTFGDYPLWIAEYEIDAPRIPSGWTTWHLWQWVGDAKITGVEKSADQNRVNDSGPDLSVLIMP